jgi:hypothetical protein
METATTTNGKLRKSLAEQIDRLDAILGGLAAALNESVAAAVKDAVGLAVRETIQAVMTEVFANPAVLEMLNGATVQPAKVGVGERLRTAVNVVVAKAKSTITACKKLCGRSVKMLTGLVSKLAVVRHCKAQLVTALGVGCLAGVAVYLTGPWLAVMAGGLGGFAATSAVQGWLWLRRVLASAGVWRG